jgi:hypothetical protein
MICLLRISFTYIDRTCYMDELLDGNYGAGTLTENERIHYGDLKDRYCQRRDRTR